MDTIDTDDMDSKYTNGVGPAADSQHADDDGVDIILVQRAAGLRGGFCSGWDVILPASWGRVFWKALVYAGARAMGMLTLYFQATSYLIGSSILPNMYALPVN